MMYSSHSNSLKLIKKCEFSLGKIWQEIGINDKIFKLEFFEEIGTLNAISSFQNGFLAHAATV